MNRFTLAGVSHASCRVPPLQAGYARPLSESCQVGTTPVPQTGRNVKERLIRDVPLLARLSDADLKALASAGHLREFSSSDAVVHQGDPGDSLHVVVEGRIRISMLSSSGEEATVAMVGPGDCVGELSLFDGRPRSATATAMGPTRTFVVTRDAFVAWVRHRPDAALALLETLALRLRRTDEALADLTFLDVPHRLALQLVRMASADALGRDTADRRLKITQADIASMLGVSRESVNKQLNRFVREGWVTLGRGWVRLENVDALRTFD